MTTTPLTATDRLEQFVAQLKSLTDSPQATTKKAREKRRAQTEDIARKIESLKAYLTLAQGQRVTDGKQLGAIAELLLSPGGMPEAWVSWYGKVPQPEQPERLKPEPRLLDLKVGDSITINSQHEGAALKTFEIKEFRGSGRVLTTTNQLFHCDFFSHQPPVTSTQLMTDDCSLVTKIEIDPEFKTLIPPLGAEERAQLEANLLAQGCRDPLVVWKGRNILLDGHNRYDLCTQHGIEFKTVDIELPDRNAAHDWIISNQLGRRNLTPEAVSYLRGKKYNLQKRQGKRNDLTCDQNDHKLTSADCLAQEYKVGSGTIRRDAQYSKAVDTRADVVGEEVRTDLLSRGVKLTKRETLKLAKEASVNPEAVRQKLKQLGETKDIQSTTVPFPYQVGEVCLVIASDEPQLRGRGGCWAIVTKVHEHSCDLQLWNGTAELIKPEYLKSMEYTPEQQQQMQSLCHRIIRLRACGDLEPAAHSILSDLGRKKKPSLTLIEEKLLSVLESEYGLKTTSESKTAQEELREVIRPDSSQFKDAPAYVEVNTNDICVAFMSNLDSLSTAHIKAVGKAIAVRAPHLAPVMATSCAVSSDQAVAIVKALTLIYPEAIRDLIEEINNDLSMNNEQ